MFSSLAVGAATLDGKCLDVKSLALAKAGDTEISRVWSAPYAQSVRSSRTLDGFVSEDGQLHMPKTYVTRKGALVLFTPPTTLPNSPATGQYGLTKDMVVEAGMQLGTIGNLATSVLEFGKENEELLEKQRDSRQKAFVQFVHDLDSEDIIDKHAQPGCDQDFYLEELKSRSSLFGQSVYSLRTDTNYDGTYAGRDDEETSGRTSRLSTRSPDHFLPQIPIRQTVSAMEFHSKASVGRSSPPPQLSPTMSRRADIQGRPRANSAIVLAPFSDNGQKSINIPPSPEPPKANPRITSARPPPSARALGTTPSSIENILFEGSDIEQSFSRRRQSFPKSQRRASSYIKLLTSPPDEECGSTVPHLTTGSRISSAPIVRTVYSPTRLFSPDGVKMQRLDTPTEVDEGSSIGGDSAGTDSYQIPHRPTSSASVLPRAVSARSSTSRKSTESRRVASAGGASSFSEKEAVRIPSEPSLGDQDEAEDEIVYRADDLVQETTSGRKHSGVEKPLSSHSRSIEGVSQATVTRSSEADVESIGHDIRARSPEEKMMDTESDEARLSPEEVWREVEEDNEEDTGNLTQEHDGSLSLSQRSRSKTSAKSHSSQDISSRPQTPGVTMATGTVSDATATGAPTSHSRSATPQQSLLDLAGTNADSQIFASEQDREWSQKPEQELEHLAASDDEAEPDTGRYEGVVSPSVHLDEFETEKSRPGTPLSDEVRRTPVQVDAVVSEYLKNSHEPLTRPVSGGRKSSQAPQAEGDSIVLPNTTETKENESAETNQEISEDSGAFSKPSLLSTPLTAVDTSRDNYKGDGVKSLNSSVPQDVLFQSKSASKDEGRKTSVSYTEFRKVSLAKAGSLKGANAGVSTEGKLELEGLRQETGKFEEKAAEPPIIRKSSTDMRKTSVHRETKDVTRQVTEERVKMESPKLKPEPPKTEKLDLSELAAMVNRNKPVEKEKKSQVPKTKQAKNKKVKGKDTFTGWDVPPTDEAPLDISKVAHLISAEDLALIQEAPPATPPKTVEIPPDQANVPVATKRNSFAPSKVKKATKKELAQQRANERKENKRKHDEARKKREQEERERKELLNLIEQKEEEQRIAEEEAEARQQMLEEEKAKRLADEEEAREQEELAREALKDARRKAKDEREVRRAAEAEKKRLEVQKKREEKRLKELKMQEREQNLLKQQQERDERLVQVREARMRQEEMDLAEEERRKEEEKILQLQEQEEERRLEEESLQEAEQELQRMIEEREHREQMRKIAELQAEKIREEENRRLKLQEVEKDKLDQEKRRLAEVEEQKLREEKERLAAIKRQEALARIRAAAEMERRKAWALRRREVNMERMQHLKNTRMQQGVTRPWTFTYFVHIPRRIWELPIGWGKKKRGGFRPPPKKKPPPKGEEGAPPGDASATPIPNTA